MLHLVVIRVSDILSGSMSKYLSTHKLSYKQQKVVYKITNCFSDNSPKLIFDCTNKECNYSELKNKPCRDRHCNRCNNNKKLKWVIKLVKDFPPLPYYHIVFTIPSELHNLSICNQELLYHIFFKSSFYVLNKFAGDKKYFGGKIGYLGLLHTWGEKLNYHPHIHFITLAGGISDGVYKKLPYHKKFIFPVKAMSKVMMGKFIEMLKNSYTKGELNFPGKLEPISSDKEFNKFLYLLSNKRWVVDSRIPMPQSEKVLEYISRYTHKVAISNYRIKSYKNGKVSFQYKDYKDRNKQGIAVKKIIQFSDMEFIRRYLLHILPDGFRKIRYGGIFSSNRKKEALRIIRETLKEELEALLSKTSHWIAEMETRIKIVCPLCSEEVLPRKVAFASGYT